MLCGLDAINHLMINQGRMPIDRGILDDIADNVAAMEAIISPDTALAMPHEEGNYHVTVMSIAIKQLVDMFVQIWTADKKDEPPPVAYLIGNGAHWQALVQEPGGWFVRDKKSYQVHNLKNYLEVCSRRGMVLSLTKQPSETGGDMDWQGTPNNNKRLFEEVEIECAASSTANAAINVDEEDDERPEKMARSDQPAAETTQELLLQTAVTEAPPPSTINEQPEAGEWVSCKKGVTNMLYNEALNMYKCTNCNFQKESSLSVAIHSGRYCNPHASQKGSVKPEEEEDII